MKLTDAAAALGKRVGLTTMDGWETVVEVRDIKSAYGATRVLVHQAGSHDPRNPSATPGQRWVNADRLTRVIEGAS